MTTKESKEIRLALDHIISVSAECVIVKSKQAAETFSQILLDASDYNVGAITGPYLVNGNENIKRWHVEK